MTKTSAAPGAEKLKFSYGNVEDYEQSDEVIEAQRTLLTHMIDNIPVPKEVEELVVHTDIKAAVLRDAVRYVSIVVET